MSRFLEALRSKKVLLMDGAMGTELQRAGAREGECLELWNVTRSERVRAIHQSYVGAGAVCLVTNTFQSNPAALKKHGCDGDLEIINRAAVSIARSVTGHAFALGDIGPIADHSQESAVRLVYSFREADGLLVETCSDDTDLANVQAAAPAIPTLVSFAFLRNHDGQLMTAAGHTPEKCANLANTHYVAALGVNCGREIGMDDVIEVVRRYRHEVDLPLFARPNAGTPIRDGENWIYPQTPEMTAARLTELLEAGVLMVGGCCGTTPAHVSAFRPIIEKWNTA